MIHLLIFSKNRAAQLDLLLRSIRVRADIFDINVLYRAEGDHAKSYEILKKQHDVKFCEEENFYKDTLELSVTNSEYICYGVDDDFFINAVPGYEFWTHSGASYSLRLHPGVSKKHAEYNFSVDFHIMHTDRVGEALLQAKRFKNPNQFESAMCGVYPRMFHSFSPEPYVVGIPVNRVSKTSKCAFGEKYFQHEDELNKNFLLGKRLKFPKPEKTNNVHVECKLEFE